MSAVTLESLWADFVEQRERRCAAIAKSHGTTPDRVSAGWQYMDADRAAMMPIESIRSDPDLMMGAVYVIARDYDLPAAMLFKLSDGAIDPREQEKR